MLLPGLGVFASIIILLISTFCVETDTLAVSSAIYILRLYLTQRSIHKNNNIPS